MTTRYQAARGRKKRVLAQARLELEQLPARLVTRLPVAARIVLQHTETHQVFEWELGPWQSAEHDAHRRAFTLEASEVEAVVAAAEAERVFASDLVGFALRKLHEPAFRVTLPIALGGAAADLARAPRWTLGELLRWLELEIVDISLETDRMPATRKAA